MKRILKFGVACLILACLTAGAFAQRPRVADSSSPDSVDTPAPAPSSVKAKYEGGVFGYNQKIDGSLSFDDVNRRLVFRNKFGKEMINIPYDAVLSTFGDTQSRRPTAASIIGSAVPYGLGIPALFIKKKYRYLTLQFEDPDTRVAGITSFKVDNQETLASVVYALGTKAGLTQRGEVFVRQRPKRPDTGSTDPRFSSTSIIRVDGREPVSRGVVNGLAITLPKPVYPATAREAKVSGTVTVQIVIDEDGNVVAAKAVSGHPLLHDAAVDAALQAKFAPTKIDGEPVRATGVLTYDFVL